MAKNYMSLYGKNAVIERLRANPQSIHKIFLQENFDDEKVLELIRRNKIDSQRVSGRQLSNMKRADRLQGVIAQVDNFVYIEFKELLLRARPKKMTLILLDGLNDPQNLGVIIRCAACFGGFAIVIPQHHSCEVTETVLHVASGGENYVPISKGVNLSTALIEAKKAGYWVAGAMVEGGEDARKVELPFPLALVLGSEGKGIRQGLEKQIDLRVSLPMKGSNLSFNVAMAAAIFCYEIVKQRSSE